MTKPGIYIWEIAKKIGNHFGDPEDCRFVLQELLRVEQSAIRAERIRCAGIAGRHIKGSNDYADAAEVIRNRIMEPEILAPNGETK